MLKKAIYLPFLIGMAQLPIVTYAQLSEEKGEKHIVVNSKTIRVAALLGIFSKETALEFSFNSKKLDPSREITVMHHDQTLSAWLKELEKTTGIHVRVKGDHIIFQDAPVPVQTTTAREAGVVNSPAVKQPVMQRTTATGNKSVQSGGTNPDMAEHPSGSRRVAGAMHLSDKNKVAATDQKTKANDSTGTQEYISQQKERVDNGGSDTDNTTQESNSLAAREATAIADNNVNDAANHTITHLPSGMLSKEELHLLPAYEMPTPDKQIGSVAHMAVVDVKETTAAVVEHPVADTTATSAPPLRKLTSLELGLQGVGLAFELPVAEKITVKFSAGLGGGYDLRNDFSYEWGLADPCVYLSVNPRYYYNRDKRERKGKRNTLNAGHYIGLRIKYTSTSISEADMTDAIVSNIHWGMQTPIGRKWVIDGHAGVGWGFNFIDTLNVIHSRFYPAVEIRFSYILNKKKNL